MDGSVKIATSANKYEITTGIKENPVITALLVVDERR